MPRVDLSKATKLKLKAMREEIVRARQCRVARCSSGPTIRRRERGGEVGRFEWARGIVRVDSRTLDVEVERLP